MDRRTWKIEQMHERARAARDNARLAADIHRTAARLWCDWVAWARDHPNEATEYDDEQHDMAIHRAINFHSSVQDEIDSYESRSTREARWGEEARLRAADRREAKALAKGMAKIAARKAAKRAALEAKKAKQKEKSK